MNRVLLTGATGFIGRHAARHLLSEGYEVHTAARHTVPDFPPLIRQHAVDLHDSHQTAALLAALRPSRLLHLAWDVSGGDYWGSPENRRWVQSSAHLLKCFVQNGGRRVVSVGSCAEYDWSISGEFKEDSTPLKPATLYGTCKHEFHQIQDEVARESGISGAWARLFFLYGPWERTGRLVSTVSDSLLKGEPALCTSGEQWRDYMHVEDAARALVLILGGPVEGAINVASGELAAVQEIARFLAEIAGHPELLRIGAIPSKAGEPRRICADITRLRSLGFKPRYTLAEGLRQTLEWRRRHGHAV
jgi:nucleoside-diphosphate-sugar epimerase